MKLKNITLTISLLTIILIGRAQITLEATYDSAYAHLYIVNLEVDGEKIIRIIEDSTNRQIRLYNLNHSLWKTINLNNMPVPAYQYFYTDSIGNQVLDTYYVYNYDVLYVTQHLFNLDDNVELMFFASSMNASYTRIVDEFGTVIFAADSAGPWVKINIPQIMKPIYNTAAGTKMILSGWNNQAKVYSLAGTLTHENEMLLNDYGNPKIISYPNPTRDYAIIHYELPNEINKGEIVFYNMNGSEIKRFAVDRTFKDLRISVADLSTGTYFYQLQTSVGKETKKMVIIR